MEKAAIEKAIQKNHGNISKAAKELGLGRTTIYRKLDKYGTGIGLSFARQIMKLNNGDIGVISDTGHGTTFTLTI